MVSLILDPKNHSVFDDIELDLNILNDRRRTPLLLCFTPPTATYLGLRNGISDECMPIPSKPEDIEIPSDWIKPGGPRQRELCVAQLLAYGANVNIRDYHDYTPLHYACMWGWASTVKLLIDAGANVNDTNFQGRTPLMLAIEFGNASVVELLLRIKDVFANGVDADGNTCLILAAEHGESGNDMCRMLLRCGADPNTENRKGKSPLLLACQLQNLQLVFDLLDNKVQRKGEAFALLEKDKMVILHRRLQEEERQAALEAAKLQKEREQRAEDGGVDMAYSGYKKRSPWGCWVQYNDKRGRGIFYYNYVKCFLFLSIFLLFICLGVAPESVGGTCGLQEEKRRAHQRRNLRYELLSLTENATDEFCCFVLFVHIIFTPHCIKSSYIFIVYLYYI